MRDPVQFRNNGQTCVCAKRIYVQAGGLYALRPPSLKARVEKMEGLVDGF